ncbi:MAG TPA: ABC transporter ATP-binding protein [Acidimicrobiales bacterium]|nr:ABC transporter ATP-binding protein [Acidimicrobiales bacterium]
MAGRIPAVSMRGITKRFPGVVANDRIDFEADPGEVHALLGENGAGKSTLSHILSGLYRPDGGEIYLAGQKVSFASPRDAIDAGVCMVHQHFRLVARFTVSENIILGDRRGAGRRFRIRADAVESQVRALCERYNLPVDPRARIWQLSVGEQQRVEILKALYQDARVLILDEPTAVLTPNEADSLFVTLREIASENRTVIFISHKLNEVEAVSDRVTVLRGGRHITTVRTSEATPQSLADLMIGHDFAAASRPGNGHQIGAAMLEIDGLWADGDRGVPAVKGVSLAVRAGEVVAVAGVAGNGQRELAETIAGVRPGTQGQIRLGGERLKRGDPRAAFDAGVRYIPEDRLGTGVSPSLSVAMNLELRSFRDNSFGPFLKLHQMRAKAEEAITKFGIKASGPDAQSANLSGGNIQKVVIAREFAGAMKVLVAASPTRGLDVAAVAMVHSYLLDAAAKGVSVLLLSEDLSEILALNDRIVVMYEGRLVEVVDHDDVGEIALRMAGRSPETKAPGETQLPSGEEEPSGLDGNRMRASGGVA